MLCLSVVHHVPKMKHNSNGYTHVFEAQLFKGVAGDVTGSRVVPEIDIAAAQTGSINISAHKTARNKIPTPIFIS